MGLKVFSGYKIPRRSNQSTASQQTDGPQTTTVHESKDHHGYSRKHLRDKVADRSPPSKKRCSYARKINSALPTTETKNKDLLAGDNVYRHNRQSTASQRTSDTQPTIVRDSKEWNRNFLRNVNSVYEPPKQLASTKKDTDNPRTIINIVRQNKGLPLGYKIPRVSNQSIGPEKIDGQISMHKSQNRNLNDQSTAPNQNDHTGITAVNQNRDHRLLHTVHGFSKLNNTICSSVRFTVPQTLDWNQLNRILSRVSDHKEDIHQEQIDSFHQTFSNSQPTAVDPGLYCIPQHKNPYIAGWPIDCTHHFTKHCNKKFLTRYETLRYSQSTGPRQFDNFHIISTLHKDWTHLAKILTIIPELSVPCKQILNKLKVPQIVDWKDMERIISTIPVATRSPKPVKMLQNIKSQHIDVSQQDNAFPHANQVSHMLAVENQEYHAPETIDINHTSNQGIKTNRRKQKFIYESHEFYHVNNSNDGILSFWRCSQHQKSGCQCRIHVEKATSQVVHMEMDHSGHGTNGSVTPPVQGAENQVENINEVTNKVQVVKPNPQPYAMDRRETALIRANAIIEEFRNRCKKAKRSKDFAKLSTVYIDMAEHASSLPEGSSTAKSHYKKAILIAKEHGLHETCYTAYRGLAELSLNCGNTNDAITKVDDSVHFAWQSENRSKIQQARHYQAYVYSRNLNWLEKSLEIALQCMKYLEDNTDEINSDAENGGNAMCRIASLEMLLSEIYYKMGDMEQALLYCERCLGHARNYKDTVRTRRFELIVCAWMMKSDLSSDRGRLEAAKEAARVAQKIPWKSSGNSYRVKSQVQLQLGIAHLRLNNITESKSILWFLYTSSRKDLSDEDNESLSNCLVLIYKTEKRLEKLAPLQGDSNHLNEVHKKTFEKIADAASVLGLHELAHHYYDKMLRFCLVDEDKRAVLLSMAESANDFNDYQSALILFEEVLALEEQLGCSEETLLQTKCMIAAVSAKNKSIDLEQRIQLLKDAYKECITSSHKNINLTLFCLESYLKFYADNPIWQEHELEVKALTDAQNKLKHELESYAQESSEENSICPIQSDFLDEFDGLTDEQILSRFKTEMKMMEEQQKLLKQIDTKINVKGETRFHFAARDGSYENVYKLIENGYNINAEDNGGWTPLSEAVSAGHTSIVRLLLQNQAKPDCRSKVELLNKKGNIIAARGQTPLMEACANGNATIIQDLIHYNANVTLMDDNEWTAADHLRYYMTSNKNIDNKDTLKKLFEKIEERQRRAGFTPRKLPLTSFVNVKSRNRGKASTKRKERRSSQLVLQSPPKLLIECGNNNSNGERTEVQSTKKRRIFTTKIG